MFNYEIAMALVEARKMNKWVPVRYMVKYGLHKDNALYLEDKGHVTVRYSALGPMVKLTAEGYYEALRMLDTTYTQAN